MKLILLISIMTITGCSTIGDMVSPDPIPTRPINEITIDRTMTACEDHGRIPALTLGPNHQIKSISCPTEKRNEG